MVDNFQDCHRIIPIIYLFLPTITVTSFNAPPNHPVADLDPLIFWVNIQDLLQVFQESGIGKMEDNQLTSADPLSYTTRVSTERSRMDENR